MDRLDFFGNNGYVDPISCCVLYTNFVPGTNWGVPLGPLRVILDPTLRAADYPTGQDVPPKLVEILGNLRAMETLDSNWDSYGSEPPTHTAICAARDLIWIVYSSLPGRKAALPFTVMPLSGGGVQIEFRGDGGAIEIEVNSEGAFGYLLIRGTGPFREFDERDVAPLSRVVELVQSLSS